MTSSKPYLLRALYQWVVDNGMTPQILVQVAGGEGNFPMPFVKDGKIVLNISPSAVRDLDLGDADICFNARFGGTPMRVTAPVAQILAIYARENGQGMMFNPEETPTGPKGPQGLKDLSKPDGKSPPSTPGDNKPKLKLVK